LHGLQPVSADILLFFAFQVGAILRVDLRFNLIKLFVDLPHLECLDSIRISILLVPFCVFQNVEFVSPELQLPVRLRTLARSQLSDTDVTSLAGIAMD
jgi:hypothetical protein